jgi:uncharacterized coiled-coil DUF342 family protein
MASSPPKPPRNFDDSEPMLRMIKSINSQHVGEIYDWAVTLLVERDLKDAEIHRMVEAVALAKAEKDGMKVEVWTVRQRFAELESVIAELRKKLAAFAEGEKK